MVHTRECQQSMCKTARVRCRLLLRWKRAKKYHTTKWMRCSNCCHDFADMSLHNFSDFLCRRHEDEAIKLISVDRSCRRQICQINRHSRLQKLRHKKMRTAATENHQLIVCPPHSLPASFHLSRRGIGIPVSDATELTRLSVVGNNVRRRMFSAHSFGPPTCSCSYCGAMLWFEERVKKGSTNSNPKFSICCQKGKVQLPAYQPAPSYLMDLLNYSGGSVSKEFRRHIRVYNSIFAFTSMGGNVDSSINNSRGPYVFRLNGQNHHRIGSLLPSTGKPKFAQLYFYDTSNEVSNRVSVCGESVAENLNVGIVSSLICMFNQCSELAKVFRMARERFHVLEYQPITVRLLERRCRDGRQYNLPTSSEIAALIDNSNADSCGCRDIVIEDRNGVLKRISEKHPSFMSMQYPLLFPYGEDGFRSGIQYREFDVPLETKRTTVTMREYYAYAIQRIVDDGSVLLWGGRLFHQFIVDSYTCIEEDRLSWVNNNQSTLRCELYKGLQDAITAGDTSARAIGRKIVLPSSFTGGPRYMVQNYQDAMAICRWAGSPDFFVTFTCNPKWPEIEMALLNIPGQKAEDRPDIVSRVFHLKLMELLRDIKTECHFGKVKALVYTIEFQKRGLSHAHILIFVFGDQRPNTVGQVDAVVSAEIPDKHADPFAYQSVCQYMIHGPCGYANPGCACMVEGSCSKHYPKQYRGETSFDKFGFPMYRRRNNGMSTETSNGFVQDNGWVIPHNVDLVVKYQAHINVEICNRSRSVKYLFKYINKGHDRATVVIEDSVNKECTLVQEVDEVKTYLDCRYISASEASWRIFEFDVQYRTPAVERLMFHLPGEQTVYFDETDHLNDVQGRHNPCKTMFTQWLGTNRMCHAARQLTYVDFPTKWVWDKSTKEWRMRQKGECIGRIYYAHPTSGERFYMRMLLNIVRGPTCYEDIRSVNGVVFNTFKDACLARGLLDDDNEWDEALTEAASWASPNCMRELFATLLCFCEVSNAKQLWDKHWEKCGEDMEWRYARRNGCHSQEMCSNRVRSDALIALEKIMLRNNRSLTEFWSVTEVDLANFHSVDNTLVDDEVDYDCDLLRMESQQSVPLLNSEQKMVFDAIVHSVRNRTGGFYFVYGSGGTGKTFLWNTLACTMRAESRIVLAVASSGIASLLLPGGRTAHSKFKIPMNLDDMSTCNISKQSCLADLLRRTDLIIWDEAPMVHRNALEAFEKSLSDIASSDSNTDSGQIFGGKTVVLGGDFRQTLPVVRKGTREMIVRSAISFSPLWQQCKVFTLTINMRLKNNSLSDDERSKLSSFSTWILNVGEGKVRSMSLDVGEEPTWIQIPDEYLIPDADNAIHAMVEITYPDLETNILNKSYLQERCILAPTNDCVEEINSYAIDLISGTMQTYYSADTISPVSDATEEQHLLYPTEFLNTLKLSGLPNHELRLKVGVPIMLMRNLNQSLGLCNGTRLIVAQLSTKVIEAEIVTGKNVGRKVLIPRIVLTSDDTKWPFVLRRRQFPINVCFAMTINKSQGQTLEQVGIYLPRPVFTHGQLYVALSRTTSMSGLKILLGTTKPGFHNYTQNVVYREVFRNISGMEGADKPVRDF